jgi:hypothetical protein
MAFPFFGEKKKEKEIQPESRTEPSLITPENPSGVRQNPVPDTNPLPASAVPAGRSPAIEPVQALVSQGVYTQEFSAQTEPVTRGQFAQILVKALNHNLTLFSEFPFYRDVATDHPNYAAIEIAREKKLTDYQSEQGFYHPDQAIQYRDVYLAISHAITGAPPSRVRAEHLLRNLPQRSVFTEAEYNAVAKMTQSRFFSRVRRHETTFQPLETEVTPQGLAPFINFMMFLNERRAPIVSAEDLAPQLPAGIRLVVSPSTGILEERLKAGGRIRFQLVSAVETLPKGSMVRGVVQEAKANRTYIILFDTVRTTEGQNYETRAELSISFSAKDKLGFIVPGETFEVMTQSVPADEAPTLPESVPPPNAPPTGVPNSKVLNQPVKTIAK